MLGHEVGMVPVGSMSQRGRHVRLDSQTVLADIAVANAAPIVCLTALLGFCQALVSLAARLLGIQLQTASVLIALGSFSLGVAVVGRQMWLLSRRVLILRKV